MQKNLILPYASSKTVMSLGEKIAALRKSKGISQELLAENSRISLRTIQRIESGSSIPRLYTLKVIAEALDVPIDQLNATEDQHDREGLASLRLINLSALAVFIFPFANILLPLLIWRTNRHLPLVNAAGKKIISFQILWTLGTLLIAVATHMILLSLTKSVSIGRLPPTVFLVYFVFLAVNVLFIIRSAIHLNKNEAGVYSFVPVLF